MSRCLVTGGAGFIGSALVRALLARGHRVRVLDNFTTGTAANLEAVSRDVEVLTGDIRDEDALTRACTAVEVVFHEAALVSVPQSLCAPLDNYSVNATGTLQVLEAARRAGVRRVVYAASSAAYGDDPVLPKVETMRPTPISPYGASKLAGEIAMQVYARAFGLETVCLRYFNVFGPRQDPRSQYAAVIPKFIVSALTGTVPRIFGDGTQSRDFCHIDNVVEANMAAAFSTSTHASGGVFNIGCGHPVDLNSVVAILGEFLGRPLGAHHDEPRPGDIKHSWGDIAAARAVLGFAPTVPFREGLRTTLEWYASLS